MKSQLSLRHIQNKEARTFSTVQPGSIVNTIHMFYVMKLFIRNGKAT